MADLFNHEISAFLSQTIVPNLGINETVAFANLDFLEDHGDGDEEQHINGFVPTS